MKKVLLLLYSLLLVFSLCSCEAEEAQQGTTQPEGKKTAEEAIEYATPLSCPDLRDEIADDLDTAKKTYEGYYYLMNLIVDDIRQEDYIRATFNVRGYHSNKGVYFAAYLPEEEREGIALENVIQVVGKISAIEKQFNGAVFVEITDAHCLGMSFPVSGEIQMVDHDSLGRKYCILVDGSILSDHREILVYLPEDSGYAVGDTISAVGKVTIRPKDNASMSVLPPTITGGYTEALFMEEPDSIEIIGG